MCGTSPTDDLLTLGAARAAADDLLAGLRVPLAKALDVSTAHGFDAAVARLAARLRRVTAAADADALRQALAVLDIDWHAASSAQRSALVREAMAAAGRATAQVSRTISAPLGRDATEVAHATRSDARRRHTLTIGADLNALDRRAIGYVTRTNTLFVRDEYGRRLESFG